MKEKGITLVVQGKFEKKILDQIARDVETAFGWPVSVVLLTHAILPCFDATRKQYDANCLLELIHNQYSANSIKTIGLFHVDLFIPILTYIFGQAQYNGSTGVASVYRLRNEQYGMPGDEQLLYERFQKIVIHELGHAFGLVHCHVPICVMRPGTYVEDIDQKKPQFCNKCSKQLEAALSSF
ncbi:archaemetzincin family Zn-dependent metalloprotease [Draconibacterium halophilum]|uniref:Archaemetzincin family Zn-dependent metalloprotease n=1 Tax=Draconibacterium halophilum TaxID=2706887 RepID=A0A6C0RBR6_9BACT|nr:archaemetzincin family Zn-dependent metalloprotease [Draconibacterium halophilum]QIA07507.1 archaemetzincin family Zn-dependent metalloprotease [Draconibacterium halophilum]